MKRNRFIVILVAMAMSMLIVQGALATDADPTGGPEVAAEGSPLDEILASIEADRSAAVDDLVNSFASDEATAGQLRATLASASVKKLAEIIQNANSLEDVNAILAGTEGILALGDLDKDYVYTPVTPCRIIDTRAGGGGVFFPGQAREYYVYGSVASQGGNPAGCPSPRGEPRGVHINVTAVPQSGQGNFAAYPANVGPPNASLVNYRAGVQNVANAGTIKTFFNIGPREIEFLNSFGSAHLVVDVLGYYHDSAPGLAGYVLSQAAERSSDTLALCSVASASWSTLASVTLTAPSNRGIIWVHANGISRHRNDEWGRVCIARAGSNCSSWAPVLDQSSGEVAEGAWDNETRWVVSDTFPATGGSQTFQLKGCKANSSALVDFLWDDFVGLYLPNRY